MTTNNFAYENFGRHQSLYFVEVSYYKDGSCAIESSSGLTTGRGSVTWFKTQEQQKKFIAGLKNLRESDPHSCPVCGRI